MHETLECTNKNHIFIERPVLMTLQSIIVKATHYELHIQLILYYAVDT